MVLNSLVFFCMFEGYFYFFFCDCIVFFFLGIFKFCFVFIYWGYMNIFWSLDNLEFLLNLVFGGKRIKRDNKFEVEKKY